MIFFIKSFFYTILEFVRSYSAELGDIDAFVQLISSLYKSDKPINVIGVDKNLLKCDWVNGSIVSGTREPISFSFARDKRPGQKLYKEPGNELSKK